MIVGVCPSLPVAPVAPVAPCGPVAPVFPFRLPAYTHLAADAAPLTVHLYVHPVDVFKYISFTNASVIPEFRNTVAVVLVPVIAVPASHLLPRERDGGNASWHYYSK